MPTIKIKGSSTAAAEPLTLAERELAVNVTDKKLYVGDGAAVRKIVGSLGNQEASAVAITGGSIAGITDLAVADGGTGASTAADARTNLGITATGADTTYAFRSNNLSDLASASTARTNLGLGSIATQASSSVSITGGSITGVTDIAIADGGTGASTAADARTNLGLGSIATQSASSVAITGGTISGITDLAVADGGTGASTAADARTNLSVPSTTGSGASGTWGIDISGNAATATSATSATTATNLAGGAANRVPYQSASGTTTFVAAPTVTNSYLKWNGTALGWDTVSGGGGGSGDVVGPASATDSQIALFNSTTGKLIKAATTTGLLKASTGVIAAAVSGTDYAPATSGSANQLLASNGTGGFTNLTTGTGVVTALGVNTESSGAFVVNGGALGTPLSGTVTNLTGTASININGTVGATTANTGAFTTLSATGNTTLGDAVGDTLTVNATATFNNADATIYGVRVGRGAGAVSTNTAVGASALAANTSGDRNTAVGYTALASNTTGWNNAAFGRLSLNANTSGDSNAAMGSVALYLNTTGTSNAALGYTALGGNTTGSSNTGVGTSALFSNTTAGNNTAVGNQALYSNTTGVATFGTVTGGSGYTNGTYNGVQLTYSSGTTATTYPTANIVVSGGAVTTVTLVSAGTGFKDTTTVLTAPAASIGGTGSGFTVPVSTLAAASNNTAVGYQAGYSNTTGLYLTAIGHTAGYTSSTANYQTFIGFQAGYTSNFSGSGGNTAIGAGAGTSLTTGKYNTFIGPQGQVANGAGGEITTGSRNTIVGAYNGNQGGLDIRTASNYIVLSDGDGNPLISTNSTRSVALNGAVPQTGTGITFPATQSASSDANTLDDYEEGTWTPTDSSGGGLTFTNAAGRYTKIGNRVLFGFTVTYPSTANANGASVSLPFTVVNVATDGSQGGGFLRYTDYNGTIWFPAVKNAANVVVYTANGLDIKNSGLSTKRIDVYGQYEIA